MDTYKYDFSVVMAVYNVEKYLREAVESLVNQTIGFDRIQLIMADDGSTDGSGAICDEYKKKYPENVVVIHKENGGVSTARNAGLARAEGKILNFMDSDDKLDRDAMKKVLSFFHDHGTEADVATIPMEIFEGGSGGNREHNSKFDLEGEVVDLFNTPFLTNYSASTSFFQAAAAKGITFDERITYGEDAKFVLMVLFQKMKLGLVRDTAYWYRSRRGENRSATQSIMYRAVYYIPYMTHFSGWALDESERLFGEIPKFAQYEVMYHLQRRLNADKLPDHVLAPEDEEKYWRLLINTACRIDDDVILAVPVLKIDRKFFILKKKHGSCPDLCVVDDKTSALTDDSMPCDIELQYGSLTAAKVSDMETIWDFVKYHKGEKKYYLEGCHLLYGTDGRDFSPVLVINGRTVECEVTERHDLERTFLGEKTCRTVGFRSVFSLEAKENVISAALVYKDTLIQRKTIRFGSFFPLSAVYKNAYAILDGSLLTTREGSLRLDLSPGKFSAAQLEIRLLCEIWKRNLLGGRKAIGGRIYYHVLKPFKKKDLWIVSDRIMKADDNGEAFFIYLQEHKPQNTRVVFALNKNSADYQRLSKIGEVVSAMSFRHKLLHLLCDVNISSQADNVTVNPYDGHYEALRDLLGHQKFVFLQHGIILHDLSGWLNRHRKAISGFVTSAVREHDSIAGGKYDYPSSVVWLTGLPRYDRLYHNEDKVITVMPTWRRDLTTDIDIRTGTWKLIRDFEKSDYYRFYNALINSERLLKALSEYGYRLQFFPHPNLQPHIERFRHDGRVSFLSLNTSYRDVYAQSNLIVTDYSSAMFDFAYLRKPIIYCHFDRDRFFGGTHTLEKGYFDYDEDGFGEVAFTLEETVDCIIRYVENGCVMPEKFRHRVDRFFAFQDNRNCQRVLEKILDLVKGDKNA